MLKKNKDNILPKEENNNIKILKKTKSSSLIEEKAKDKFTSSDRSSFLTEKSGKKRNTTGVNTTKHIYSPMSSVYGNRETSERSFLPDVNIYIQNSGEQNTMNNIHVHVYNYHTDSRMQKYKIPPISSNTFESFDDREREEPLESLYETPKKGSMAENSDK